MMYVMTFFVAIVSALCPLVNLELYISGVAAFAAPIGTWPIAFTAATGQSLGKLFWYQVGRSSMHWNFVQKIMQRASWKKQYNRVTEQIDKRPWTGNAMVFASATVGLPPLAIMAVIAGQLHFSRVAFYVVTTVGRTMRFAVVLGGVAWLVRWT